MGRERARVGRRQVGVGVVGCRRQGREVRGSVEGRRSGVWKNGAHKLCFICLAETRNIQQPFRGWHWYKRRSICCLLPRASSLKHDTKELSSRGLHSQGRAKLTELARQASWGRRDGVGGVWGG